MTQEFDYLDLIGKPYTPDFDCWRLVVEVYRRRGISLPADFAHATSPAEAHAEYLKGKTRFTEIMRPEPCCIVTFRAAHPRYVSHVGIMLDTVRFLHVQKKTAACVERIDSPLWQHKIAGFYVYAA